jgi:hypothetical protein
MATMMKYKLLPRIGVEYALDGDLSSGCEFVLAGDFSDENVVRVPLFGESDAVLWPLVFGLEVAVDLPVVERVLATSGNVHSPNRRRLAVQLEQPKVVALPEDVTGRLAQITVRWRGHLISVSRHLLIHNY